MLLDAPAALLALVFGSTVLVALPLLNAARACALETLSTVHETETLALYIVSVAGVRTHLCRRIRLPLYESW